MLDTDNTTKLYGLDDVIVDKVEISGKIKHICGQQIPYEERTCPHCGSHHCHSHDIRTAHLNDLDICGVRTVLHLKSIDINVKIAIKYIRKQADLIRKDIGKQAGLY